MENELEKEVLKAKRARLVDPQWEEEFGTANSTKKMKNPVKSHPIEEESEKQPQGKKEDDMNEDMDKLWSLYYNYIITFTDLVNLSIIYENFF